MLAGPPSPLWPAVPVPRKVVMRCVARLMRRTRWLFVSVTKKWEAFATATPQGALVAGTDGAMHGTTNSGGLNNAGTIFKVTPAGVLTTLVELGKVGP